MIQQFSSLDRITTTTALDVITTAVSECSSIITCLYTPATTTANYQLYISILTLAVSNVKMPRRHRNTSVRK